jgi:hypothetical protein
VLVDRALQQPTPLFPGGGIDLGLGQRWLEESIRMRDPPGGLVRVEEVDAGMAQRLPADAALACAVATRERVDAAYDDLQDALATPAVCAFSGSRRGASARCTPLQHIAPAQRPRCRTTEVGWRHGEGLLHRGGRTGLLQPFVDRIELFGKRRDAAPSGLDKAAVLVDRDQHRTRLVVLGDGDPAFAGNAIEDTAETVLGVARRNPRRVGEIGGGRGGAAGSRHGGSSGGEAGS